MLLKISPVWLWALAFVIFARSAGCASRLPISVKSEKVTSPTEDAERLLNYRLPNETYPEHYDIEITTEVHTGERVFQGKVVIDIVVVNTTRQIVLHALELEISKVYIESSSSNELEELSHEYELERAFLTLTRKNEGTFMAGTKWRLTVTYKGLLRDDLAGFYLSNYADDKGTDRFVASTHFESTKARYAFPCYDEPAKRANFTITLNHSPDYTAISNMPVNEDLSSAGRTVFMTTARIPTYILGFVVCDFEYTEGIVDGVRQRVYSRSSRKSEHQFALTSAMLYMKYFSSYFGIDFMLPKLDHVALTQFPTGGMENWGMITYREGNVLYTANISSIFSHNSVAEIIAHEIAHHWFGDYVTIQWWSNLWLKEGFATLFALKAIDHVYPEWNYWQIFHVLDYRTALIRDAKNITRPPTFDVVKPKDIASIYDYTSYAKSGSVLLMWNNALGEKVFQKSLQNYLKKYQYSATMEEDLFVEIEKTAKEENLNLPASIAQMMGTWTHQGGYPILLVTRNYTDGSFIVKQEAFYDDERFKEEKTWYVPVNYAVASKPDFSDTTASLYLLNEEETKINAKIAEEDWIILNKQASYFYRIKYDKENYNLITESLIEDPSVIHPRNRAQLLHDAQDLSFSNRLDHVTLLELMTYLKKEDQYAPWFIASDIIGLYNRYLKDLPDYRDFIQDLVSPVFKKLGVNETPGESHTDKLTRISVIDRACEAGVSECLKETNNKLKRHITENIKIEPNLEVKIFCNGLNQAGDEEFNFVYQKLFNSTDKEDRWLHRLYLACAQNENHIKKFISTTIDLSNNLTPEERVEILNYSWRKSKKSLLACIEFLDENWNAYGNLTEETSSNPLDKDIRKMAGRVFDRAVEEKFLSLVEKVKNSKYATDSLETYVKEKIASNYKWFEDYGQTIMSWVSHYMCC